MYFHFSSVLARLATEREQRGNHAITSFALRQRFLSSRMRLRLLSVPCACLSIAVGFILNLRVNAVVHLLLAQRTRAKFPHSPILHYTCRSLLTENNGKNNATAVGLCAVFVVSWWRNKGLHTLNRMHNEVWGYAEI